MSEIKLLPCPFCGGEAELNLFLGNYLVTCTECPGATAPIRGTTKEEAIEAWNTRKPMQEIVERLENESRYSEEAKEYARVNNPLQFERCDSYLSAIDNAIQIVQEVGGIDG